MDQPTKYWMPHIVIPYADVRCYTYKPMLEETPIGIIEVPVMEIGWNGRRFQKYGEWSKDGIHALFFDMLEGEVVLLSVLQS